MKKLHLLSVVCVYTILFANTSANSASNTSPVLDQSSEFGVGLGTLGHPDNAQTFTIGQKGTLSEIQVQVQLNSSPKNDLILDLRETTAGAPLEDNTNILAGTSISAGDYSYGIPTWVSFDVSSYGIDVEVGDVLAIVLRSPTAVNNANWFWMLDTNAYDSGQRWIHEAGGSWDGSSHQYAISDMNFRVFIEPDLPTAHTFDAPEYVFTNPDGSFVVKAILTIGSSGAEFASSGSYNIENTDAPHIIGDGFCLYRADPGEELSTGASGSLLDPTKPGKVGVYIGLCEGEGSFGATVTIIPNEKVKLSGTVKTHDNHDICAMVLASGQYMFSCDPWGDFSLSDIPWETDGSVKLQLYADGFKPYIVKLDQSGLQNIQMTAAGSCPDYNLLPSPGVYPGSAGKWIDISGKVVVGEDEQISICAMVLANGQYMFSCDGAGIYALNVPLDSNGQVKLQVYADGFAPTILYFDEFKANNDVKMARASECQ